MAGDDHPDLSEPVMVAGTNTHPDRPSPQITLKSQMCNVL